MRQVETFPDGVVLLEHCDKFRSKGAVSKRRSDGTAGSRSKSSAPVGSVRTSDRLRAFNKQTKAAASDDEERQELARVIRAPGRYDQRVAETRFRWSAR
jgi:hypothetical protein